jgi:hypothetical protein
MYSLVGSSSREAVCQVTSRVSTWLLLLRRGVRSSLVRAARVHTSPLMVGLETWFDDRGCWQLL